MVVISFDIHLWRLPVVINVPDRNIILESIALPENQKVTSIHLLVNYNYPDSKKYLRIAF
ncbi:MAG TPA: hypothetical protein PLB46_05875 [Chitinophagales bacterium]|nr:hypothetical protein [Chitinophagales bacterium]